MSQDPAVIKAYLGESADA
nr:hypothetical protein [Desulfosarcina cetonica]